MNWRSLQSAGSSGVVPAARKHGGLKKSANKVGKHNRLQWLIEDVSCPTTEKRKDGVVMYVFRVSVRTATTVRQRTVPDSPPNPWTEISPPKVPSPERTHRFVVKKRYKYLAIFHKDLAKAMKSSYTMAAAAGVKMHLPGFPPKTVGRSGFKECQRRRLRLERYFKDLVTR
jgi:hypothetical protein